MLEHFTIDDSQVSPLFTVIKNCYFTWDNKTAEFSFANFALIVIPAQMLRGVLSPLFFCEMLSDTGKILFFIHILDLLLVTCDKMEYLSKVTKWAEMSNDDGERYLVGTCKEF